MRNEETGKELTTNGRELSRMCTNRDSQAIKAMKAIPVPAGLGCAQSANRRMTCR